MNLLKRTSVLSVLLLTLFAGCSSSAKTPSDNTPNNTKTPGYSGRNPVAISVGRSTGTTLAGMGVEFDPHFFSQNVTRNDGASASDWDRIIAPRVRKMQIQRFRVMLLPDWWEPVNDNDDPAVADLSHFTFESAEMKSLYKVLDLAQETGAEVVLVVWGCQIYCDLIDPTYAGISRHFLCSSTGTSWVVEPASNEEFAENFSTLAKYLIEQKGYTCIKELTPFNEPDGNIIPLERYVPLVKVLDTRLKSDGIRSKVKLNLSDNTDTRRSFLQGCASGLKAEADLFNSHTYIFGYDTPNSTVTDWEKANVAAAKVASKIHYVGEFGSNQCVGAARQTDINYYKRGVLLARLALNFLNAGAAGASYWSLLDQYYGRHASYAEMQQLGLWRYTRQAYAGDPDRSVYTSIKSDYEVRPQYYAYSLLTRFIRKGSEVYPFDLGNDFAAGSAIRTADGKWSYIFANASSSTLSFDLTNALSGGSGKCSVYVYQDNLLPSGDELIAASQTITSQDGVFHVGVKPESVVVLTQL